MREFMLTAAAYEWKQLDMQKSPEPMLNAAARVVGLAADTAINYPSRF